MGLLLLDTPMRVMTKAALLYTFLAGKDMPARKQAILALYVLGFLVALAIICHAPPHACHSAHIGVLRGVSCVGNRARRALPRWCHAAIRHLYAGHIAIFGARRSPQGCANGILCYNHGGC
jgi:hypothetical protein